MGFAVCLFGCGGCPDADSRCRPASGAWGGCPWFDIVLPRSGGVEELLLRP